MTTTLLFCKIAHRGAARLRVDFPYDPETIARVKALPGRLWSQSKQCWHIPDTPESRRLLQELGATLVETSPDRLPDAELKGPTSPPPAPSSVTAGPHYSAKPPGASQMLVYPREGRLRLSFQYDTAVIAFIKTLPCPVYDRDNRWWSVPDTEVIRKDLATFAEGKGLPLHYSNRPTERERQPRPRKEDYPNYRTPPKRMLLSSKPGGIVPTPFAPTPICLKSLSIITLS